MFDEVFEELRALDAFFLAMTELYEGADTNTQALLCRSHMAVCKTKLNIERQLMDLDDFLISETTIQRCEECGRWCEDETCVECQPEVCWKCAGTGSDPANPFDTGMQICCRVCGGTGVAK